MYIQYFGVKLVFNLELSVFWVEILFSLINFPAENYHRIFLWKSIPFTMLLFSCNLKTGDFIFQ